jgi:hypothetical protein
MDPFNVRNTVFELVEAQHDQEVANADLASFERSNDPPRAPSEFKSMQDFLDFYKRKLEYDSIVEEFQRKLDIAKNHYDQAARTLGEILPENTPLHFTHENDEHDLEGTEFTIVNRCMGPGQPEITISIRGRL